MKYNWNCILKRVDVWDIWDREIYCMWQLFMSHNINSHRNRLLFQIGFQMKSLWIACLSWSRERYKRRFFSRHLFGMEFFQICRSWSLFCFNFSAHCFAFNDIEIEYWNTLERITTGSNNKNNRFTFSNYWRMFFFIFSNYMAKY